MPPVIDVTAMSYATAAIVVYYLFLFVVGWPRRRARRELERDWPLVVIVIPARNEAAVLERTVEAALTCRYHGEKRVLIVDDASTDDTGQVGERLTTRDDRVKVLTRDADVGGRGKSAVLNHAYQRVRAMLRSDHPWMRGATETSTCVCVLDADGHLSPTALHDGVALLDSQDVGAVQIGVQIRNARDNILSRLQDMEFVGFSFMVQTARDRLGSVRPRGKRAIHARHSARQPRGTPMAR